MKLDDDELELLGDYLSQTDSGSYELDELKGELAVSAHNLVARGLLDLEDGWVEMNRVGARALAMARRPGLVYEGNDPVQARCSKCGWASASVAVKSGSAGWRGQDETFGADCDVALAFDDHDCQPG